MTTVAIIAAKIPLFLVLGKPFPEASLRRINPKPMAKSEIVCHNDFNDILYMVVNFETNNRLVDS